MGAEKPSILQQLDALSRTRPLTQLEAIRLERALRGSERKYEHWYWSKADLLRLRRHLLNGKKPKDIASLMKRTERSIWRRMNMLGWTVRDASIWIINPGGAP
jgi:hypothetical protein